jgi:hypothetical protein
MAPQARRSGSPCPTNQHAVRRNHRVDPPNDPAGEAVRDRGRRRVRPACDGALRARRLAEDWATRPATSRSTSTTGSTDSIGTATCGVPETVVDTKERLEDLGVGDGRVFSEGWKHGEGED